MLFSNLPGMSDFAVLGCFPTPSMIHVPSAEFDYEGHFITACMHSLFHGKLRNFGDKPGEFCVSKLIVYTSGGQICTIQICK